jgi:hypothetical protein
MVFFLPHEVQIPKIDRDPERLSENEDRVLTVYGIAKQDEGSEDAEVPKRYRYHALFLFFRGNPLHHKAHGEEKLPGKADGNPGTVG